MKSILTGGAGFIGGHIAKKLLEQDGRVLIYDNLSSGKIEHLPCDPRVELIKADIKNIEALTAAMQKADQVFHLASNPDIAKAVTQPDIDFWEGTYLGLNVLEAMRITGVKRIFYPSGSGVYGDNPEITFAENYGPCIPISTYGASKLGVEAMISAYVHMFGIKATIFRFANVVGPRQTHGIGYDFVRQLVDTPTKLNVLGNGNQSKSYIHIDDILTAIWTTFSQNEQINILNVGTEDYITVSEIAKLAAEKYGTNTEIKYSAESRGWKGDVPIIRFSCEKIRKLGWEKQHTSRQAIELAMDAMYTELQTKKHVV